MLLDMLTFVVKCVAAQALVVLAHEFGHALAIQLCRGRINTIRLGTGKEWLRAGKLSFGMNPLCGGIEWDANAPHITSRQTICIAFSGVALNLCIGAVLMFTVATIDATAMLEQMLYYSFVNVYVVMLCTDAVNLLPVYGWDGCVIKEKLRERRA